MVTVNILYGNPTEKEWQKKSFKSEMDLLSWCQRNFDNIGCINKFRTSFLPISVTTILYALNGVER